MNASNSEDSLACFVITTHGVKFQRRVLERKVGSELGRALNAPTAELTYFVCHLCMNVACRRILCDDVY